MTVHVKGVLAVSHAEYVRTLRPKLPPEAFRPCPHAYLRIGVHFGIVIAGFVALRATTAIWWPLIALVIGSSMAALAFLAHDLSHRTIVTHRYLLYSTELVLWALVFMPATLWRRLHHAHHVHLTSNGDPDRAFLTSDRGLPAVITAALLFPNRVFRYNPLCLLHFLLYPIRQFIAALFFSGKPSFVTSRPNYSARDKVRILLEILFIVAIQGLIAYLVHGAYVWASIVPNVIVSAVVSWYFFTNHCLRRFHNGDDVLAATTSVTVPRVCNILHSNFSYHTEHHLFPAMNSKYYPLVSTLLKAHFPDHYHRVPMATAWSALWRCPILDSPRADSASTFTLEQQIQIPNIRLTAGSSAQAGQQASSP